MPLTYIVIYTTEGATKLKQLLSGSVEIESLVEKEDYPHHNVKDNKRSRMKTARLLKERYHDHGEKEQKNNRKEKKDRPTDRQTNKQKEHQLHVIITTAVVSSGNKQVCAASSPPSSSLWLMLCTKHKT